MVLHSMLECVYFVCVIGLVYVISALVRSDSFVVVAFLFNATATTELYTYLHTLSLHDALPISGTKPGSTPGTDTTILGPSGPGSPDDPTLPGPTGPGSDGGEPTEPGTGTDGPTDPGTGDRKSTRLNSSH